MAQYEGLVIASNYRGDYVLKNGWVYNNADTLKGYASCIIGEFDHFYRVLNNDTSIKLTAEGKEVLKAYNNCNSGLKCSYCIKQSKNIECRIVNNKYSNKERIL